VRGDGGLLARFFYGFDHLGFWFCFVDQASAFSDARFLPNLSAQVIQAALAYVTVAQDVNFVDAR
jgi:hypothetical protein